MNKLLLTALTLLLPLVTFAQTGALDVAGERIIYDGETEVDEWTVLYMFEGSLVASTHDVDEDGRINYWIFYQEDDVVREIHDLNRDGEPDLFLDVAKDGSVTNMTGEGAEQFTKPEPKIFTELVDDMDMSFQEQPTGVMNNGEDLVGDLSRIDIPGRGLSFGTYLALLVVAGIGGLLWWGWRKQKRQNEETESFDIGEV